MIVSIHKQEVHIVWVAKPDMHRYIRLTLLVIYFTEISKGFWKESSFFYLKKIQKLIMVLMVITI